MILNILAKFSLRLAMWYVGRGQYVSSNWLADNVYRRAG